MKKIEKTILFSTLTLLCLPFICSLTSCGSSRPYDPDNFIDDITSDKIVKEKVTINLFVPKSPLHGEWENMKLFKKLEERTNIHINFEEVSVEAYTERRSLAWNDAELDGFFLSNTLSDITMSQDSLFELTDLIDKYAPNYKAYCEKYPEMKRVSTLTNGKTYSFATIDLNGGDAAKQYINKTWLEALDLEMPQTVEEYYEVLKAFKEQDPNGNGRNDEIPLSWISSDQSRNFLMSCFGFTTMGCEVNVVDDNIVFVPSTNNYREYLKYANKLYAEGLLDRSIYSNKSSDLAYNGHNNNLGSFSSAGAFLVVGNELDNDYTSVGPLTSDINKTKMWYQFGHQCSPAALVINASSPYSKELVRWMDVFYSEEFEILQSYGVEGEDWHWDDEDHTTWTFDVPDGMEREAYRATITYQAGLGGSVVLTDFNRKESSEQNQKIYREADTYKPYWREPMPTLQFSLEQMQDLAIIETELSTYMTSAEANFITGNLNPNDDNAWNNHLNKLSVNKIDRLVQIYTDAYNAYKGKN